MNRDVAVVSYADREWDLTEGQVLGYGREASRSIRIRDPRISGRAGVLYVLSGCLWIRHDSASHAVTVTPRAEPSHLIPIRPRGELYGHPRPLYGPATNLQMAGRTQLVEIKINSSALTGPMPPTDVDPDPSGKEPTEVVRSELTTEQLRLLAVLAEPLLRSDGEGRPRQMRQAAERLDVNIRVIENRLTTLRRKLTDLGESGLMRDDFLTPDPRQSTDFVAKLGLLAFANGWVDLTDLAGLGSEALPQ